MIRRRVVEVSHKAKSTYYEIHRFYGIYPIGLWMNICHFAHEYATTTWHDESSVFDALAEMKALDTKPSSRTITYKRPVTFEEMKQDALKQITDKRNDPDV